MEERMLMQWRRLKYLPFVLSLIGLKMVNPSQSGYVYAFHDGEEIRPRMLSRIARGR
jgi:hypothetical protein